MSKFHTESKSVLKKGKDRYLTIERTYSNDFGANIIGDFSDDTLKRKLSLVQYFFDLSRENDCDTYW